MLPLPPFSHLQLFPSGPHRELPPSSFWVCAEAKWTECRSSNTMMFAFCRPPPRCPARPSQTLPSLRWPIATILLQSPPVDQKGGGSAKIAMCDRNTTEFRAWLRTCCTTAALSHLLSRRASPDSRLLFRAQRNYKKSIFGKSAREKCFDSEVLVLKYILG